jgi:uncharacterized protein (DUF1778 family)
MNLYCIMHYRISLCCMTQAQSKDHPLSLRLPQADLALIDRAVALKGGSRTEFMREAAVREAEMTILDSTIVRMTEAGFKSFVEAIEAPAQVNEKLLEALRRPSKWDND